MASFSIGERVQYPGQGLGTIERETEHEGVPILYVQMDSGSGIGVPIADAQALLWPLPSPERTERLLSRLLTPASPDERPWAERYESFEQALMNGSLEDYVEVLRRTLARSADVPSESGGCVCSSKTTSSPRSPSVWETIRARCSNGWSAPNGPATESAFHPRSSTPYCSDVVKTRSGSRAA